MTIEKGKVSSRGNELNGKELLEKAKTCFDLEIAALQKTAQSLGQSFIDVIHAIEKTLLSGRKLIFSGVGKNAHICNKLAGTFNSTGASSCFLDSSQALHGDIGLCAEGDLVFLFSNSGETEEIVSLIPILKRLGTTLVAITAAPDSELGRHCDLTLTYQIEREACPLNLAPTASTTAALALGDALAMVYLEVRGLTRDDFARYHPSGSLGKALLLRVQEIMRQEERFACLPDTSSVQDCLIAITHAKCGCIALTDHKTGKLSGIFTDGDFRRTALKVPNFLNHPVAHYMTRGPKTVKYGALAADVLKLFESYNVNDLIVVDQDGKPVGLVDGQDLPRFRVV